MKKIQAIFITSLIILFCLPVHAQTAKEIMDKVDAQQRKANDSTYSRSRLSSCKFSTKDKRPVCIEKPRLKEIETTQKYYGPENKDGKSISIVLEPASEKGIGMLTYSYDDEEKDTESWLYLSALGKVKRLVSGGKEEQEPVAFFGSEFTTEDMESGKMDEYSFRIVQEGKYGAYDVWIIEAIPNEERLKKTRYSKSLTWVDKEKLVTLKTQNYDKRGNVWKKIYSKNFLPSNGIWKAQETTIMNVKEGRLSTIQTDQIAINVEIDEAFLTQRTLTDFAFREKNLAQLRETAVDTQ
jgi:hypothetical protein